MLLAIDVTGNRSGSEMALPASVFEALGKGDTQAVVVWLDEGGGIDARGAKHQGTLLMGTAYVGQEAMVRMLLQRGASVNLQNSLGSTALMCAAINGHTTIAQALLDAKADASLQANNSKTALMLVEQEKHTETAQLLRQHAKRQAAEAEARAAASMVHAAAAANAMAAELLGEEAAEKEAVARKGKGKKKKAKAAPSTAAGESIEAALSGRPGLVGTRCTCSAAHLAVAVGQVAGPGEIIGSRPGRGKEIRA